LRDGILIHDSNPSARICFFETQARNEYFDLLQLPAAIPAHNAGCVTVTDVERAASGRASTTGRRRSREGCAAELATVLLASKFFQSLGIEVVSVCGEVGRPSICSKADNASVQHPSIPGSPEAKHEQFFPSLIMRGI